jgi:hypothetical protein
LILSAQARLFSKSFGRNFIGTCRAKPFSAQRRLPNQKGTSNRWRVEPSWQVP